MRKPVPSHGNLDHCFLLQAWTGRPIPRAKLLPPVMPPDEFDRVIAKAEAAIDAMLKYKPQPTKTPNEYYS